MRNYLELRLDKKISNSNLEKIIFPLGFKKKSYSKYFWFDKNNNNSLSGCYLYYQLPSKTQNSESKKTKLTLTSAVYGIFSYEDLEMLNNVILHIQKVFGGQIYNPILENSQIYPNTLTKLKPIEKKLGLTFYTFQKKLNSFNYIFERENLENEDNLEFQSLLIPFLVSLLESFFYEFYISYLESKPEILEKILIEKGRLKLNYFDLKNLLEKEKTLAELLAEYYNFQNLYSLNYAFRELLNLELLDRWSKKKINEKTYLENIQNLISQRHKIIHNLFSDENFVSQNILNYKETLVLIVNDFIDLVEKTGLKINFSKYLKFEVLEQKSKLKKIEKPAKETTTAKKTVKNKKKIESKNVMKKDSPVVFID
jgi:hypothetical protein